jgi:thiol-disulfide isomerase/thioredoxin
MSVFAAVAVIAGLLGLLNLLLMAGVIRRLRTQTETLARVQRRANGPSLAAGYQIQPFEARARDGATLTADSLGVEAVLGFFRPGCAPCEEALPKFVEFARSSTLGRNALVAVVVGNEDEVAGEVAALSPVARVVTEPLNGAVTEALSVEAFPTFIRVGPDRRVVAVGYDPGTVMLEPVA